MFAANHTKTTLGRSAILFCALCFYFTAGFSALSQNSERWEQAIKAFEVEDRKSHPPKGGVLFIGSSSIRKWDTLSEDFPDHDVINRGFGGSKIPDAIHFFERIVRPYEPSTVVLYAGDNDIGGGHTPSQVFENFKMFADLLKKRLPKAKLVFIAIKPSIKRWNLAPKMKEANKMIKTYARKHRRVVFADVWNPMIGKDGKPRPDLFIEDGLHLNAAGYEIWKKVVSKRL